MRRLAAALLLGVAGPSGCTGDEGAGPAGVVVRDSAGVRIVEHPADLGAHLPAHEVGPAPLVAVGVLEGADAYQFTAIHRVVQQSDGTLVVLDAGTQQLRYFDAAGVHKRTVGGRGSGPGEFNRVTGPYLVGDTVVVWDLNERRFTYFDRAGGFMRTELRRELPVQPLGFVASGVLIGYRSEGAELSPLVEIEEHTLHPTEHFVRLDVGSGAQDTLASLPGRPIYVHARPGQNPPFGVMAVPFGAGATARAGHGVAVITAATELRVYDAAGRLERIVREQGPRPLSPATLQAEVERLIARAPAATQAELRQRYAAIPAVATVPAYGTAFVDDRGRLWAEHYRTDDDRVWGSRATEPPVLTLFSAEGAAIATVRLPLGFALHQVSDRGLLGVYRDEHGVPYVWLLAVDELGG
jgi:hypothetical protein